MKNLFLILLLLIVIKVNAQLDSIREDTVYFDLQWIYSEIDSIDSVNNYPRHEASHYIWYNYDDSLDKYKVKINRVTEKRLKRYILDTLQLPVVKIPRDSVIGHPDFRDKMENQIINNQWNVYLKNNNIWLFNQDEDKDTLYSMNNIWEVDDYGGKIWNFDLFGVVAYANMDEVVGGYTIRQICNSMDFICKRKSNNQISVHLKRNNGEYPNWDEIKLLDDNYFTIATLPDFRTYYDTNEICEVDDVDEDITGCTPIDSYP